MPNEKDLRVHRLLEEQQRDARALVRLQLKVGGIAVRMERRQGEINGLIYEGARPPLSESAPAAGDAVTEMLLRYKELARSLALVGVSRIDLWPRETGGGRLRVEGHDPIELTGKQHELLLAVARADRAADGFPRWIDLRSLGSQVRKPDGSPRNGHSVHVLIGRVRDKLIRARVNPFVLLTQEGLGVRCMARRVVIHDRDDDAPALRLFTRD